MPPARARAVATREKEFDEHRKRHRRLPAPDPIGTDPIGTDPIGAEPTAQPSIAWAAARMTPTPLYRSEVLDAKRNRWLGSLILRQPLSHWTLTWIAIGTVAIAVAFLYVGEYARKARVEGRLVDIPTALPDASGDSHRLEAELLVPESLLAAAVVGNEVQLRYPAFPHQHYGQYRGRIVRISRQPIASASSGSTDAARGRAPGLYRATVSLEHQRVRNDRGIERDLHPGLTVQADVIVERRRLYAWLFEPFSRLRDRLRG